MSVPAKINDGNWNLLQYDRIDLSYPFVSRGDGVSVEATFHYKQDKGAYRTPNLGDTRLIPGLNQVSYLVDFGQPNDIGSNLYEFTHTYATLPIRRVEGSSVALTIPLLGDDGAGSISIESNTLTFSANVVYEYFNERPTLLTAKQMAQWFGVTYINVGNGGNVIGLPPAGEYLAEDSEIGIYKGKMYYRKSIYAVIPELGIFTPPV